MIEAIGAEKGERTATRLAYRSYYYTRSLITPVGRWSCGAAGSAGLSTELFECFQRSEKALVDILAEMYVQGVATRKVEAVSDRKAGMRQFSLSSELPH